jgi:hypothetical protein
MPKKHYKKHDEEEHLTIDQYMSVFWPHTRKQNSHIDGFLKHCSSVLNIDLSNFTHEEYDKANDVFNEYLNKVDRFAECVNILLSKGLYQKYNTYDDNFMEKVKKVHNYLLSMNCVIDEDECKQFMYEETAEGRLALQNREAINCLELIESARDRLKLLYSLLHPQSVIKNKSEANVESDSDSEKEEDTEEESHNA